LINLQDVTFFLKFCANDVFGLTFRSQADLLRVSDFVDALSAPIQFLSQAEKRAKQLQGLGIDETDISEVSVNVRQKHEPLKATDSDKALTVSVTPTSQQAAAPSTVSCTQQQTATGDKETKGAASAVLCELSLTLLY